MEEALDIVEHVIPRNNTISISVFGKEYSSIQEAYNDIKPKGKTYSQVLYSLKSGNSPEVAFSDYVPPSKFIVRGVDYGTVRNAAEHFNVCFETVRYRLKNGWTNEEAVGLEPPKPTPKKLGIRTKIFEIDGVRYTIKDLSEKYGMTPEYIRNKLRYGNSIEEVLGLVEKPKKYEVFGKYYDTIDEICDDYGITRNAFSGRRRLGWTMEQILGLEKPPEKPNKVARVLEGVRYESTSQAVAAYGIPKGTFDKRLAKGIYTEEELFGIVPILPPDGVKTRVHPVNISNIDVLRHAYNSKDEKYYECRDVNTGELSIKSRKELYELYDTVRIKPFMKGELDE